MSVVRLYPSYLRPPDAHPAAAPEELTLVALGSSGKSLGRAENLSVLFARRAAIAWGFSHMADTAESITSHLVTRAVELTGVPSLPPRFIEVMKDSPPLIGIRLRLIRPGLLIEVWDSKSGAPLPPDGEFLDDNLAAVQRLSDEWGWYRAPGGGKVIWAKLHHSADRMPHRTVGRYSYPEPDPPIIAFSDVPVMQRTLDGLQQQVNTARKVHHDYL
ncbi:ATP-binding protein [Nocardia sp. NPDC049220]|uniref:ATP-binding protein n=1 Tax=Nocardia sp. NPDC049220 TaxID=3155273 RepID=UPI00340682B5